MSHSDQKLFLRPYLPLIGGIFVLESGPRFFSGTRSVRSESEEKATFTYYSYLFLTISDRLAVTESVVLFYWTRVRSLVMLVTN